MFGYEYFKTQVKQIDIGELKNTYKYGMSLKKSFVWAVCGFFMIVVGAVFTYEMALRKMPLSLNTFLYLFIIFFGIYFIYMIFDYKVKIDIRGKKIIHKKVEIDFEKINKITLKKMFNRNKIEICVSIITDEKVQIIFPLIMNNRLEFVGVLKKLLDKKFTIE